MQLEQSLIDPQELVKLQATTPRSDVTYVGEEDSCAVLSRNGKVFCGTVQRDREDDRWHALMHLLYVGKFPTKDMAAAALELAWYG